MVARTTITRLSHRIDQGWRAIEFWRSSPHTWCGSLLMARVKKNFSVGILTRAIAITRRLPSRLVTDKVR